MDNFTQDLLLQSSYPEILYFHIPLLMLRKMFWEYVFPFTKHILKIKNTPTKKLQYVKFQSNRNYIATHVKSAYEKVKVFVVSDVGVCNDLVEKRMLGRNAVNFVGLDCEWASGDKNGAALLQLSSGNDCILYRLHNTNGVVCNNMKKLLEDRKVLKFGVAIQEDVRRLRMHGVNVKGFVDLRNLAQRCLPPYIQYPDDQIGELYQWTSLRSLSINALNMKMSKSHHIRCGDWQAPTLSKEQVLYAAKDAIVSLEVFYALVLIRKLNREENSVLSDAFCTNVEFTRDWVQDIYYNQSSLNPYCYNHTTDVITELNFKNPLCYELTKPSQWLKELAYSLCQGIVEVGHKQKSVLKNKQMRSVMSSRGLSTKALQPKTYKHQCRDKPLYENCFLLGPDNKVLATVNRSKALWYVNKGLGSVDCKSPLTVRLNFEPSGRPMPDADYYTTVKDNMCVVCGGTESFVRKMVIPHDYRKYFPQNFKDHMSHDVLLMCLDCHRIAQQGDEQLRQQLAHDYNAPLGTKERMMFVDNPDLSKVRSAAKALLHSGGKIPKERRSVLEKIVADYYETSIIDEELLRDAVNMSIKEKNTSFEGWHGERVVKTVLKAGKLEEFVKMWRQHFLDYMQPKHLPTLWSIEHNLHKIKNSQWENEERLPEISCLK